MSLEIGAGKPKRIDARTGRALPERWRSWHPVEVPERVKEARARFQPRHLADLLCATGISYWCARKWAQQPDRFAGWLAACDGLAIPYRHELDMLRYLNNATVAVVRLRMAELIESGSAEHAALYAAVDEIVATERAEGEARRKARRIEKYGRDPVPDVRRTKEERAAVKPQRAQYAKRKEASNKRYRRGRNRADQKQHLLERPGGPNNNTMREYGKVLVEANRKAKVEAAFEVMFGVPVKDWPKKSRLDNPKIEEGQAVD